ncbi:MAG: ABC transporter ATP-binding protein [Lentisphaeria bacterium]|nr:ABC transporter ATP-binding protein [Lentisphaeria bacterium]
MSSSEYLIRLENICKGYQLAGSRRLEVLHNVSGNFPRNAWTVLLGASGSGKTTLLYLIGALEKPDSGKLFFDGVNYSEIMRSNSAAARFRNSKIGFIFQNYQLLPEFTILENVLIPAKLAARPARQARERARDLLSELGLAERMDHLAGELSGGEQQRAAVARALINDPELILADEPTGNLDSATGEKLLELFGKLATDHTIIMITHNEALTAYADQVMHLSDGVLTQRTAEVL